MIKNITYVFLLIIVFACNSKKDKQEIIKKANPLFSKVVNYDNYIYVKPQFQKTINNWEEYQSLKDFIVKFKSTSPNIALSNAIELKDLVVSVKDSVKPKFIENPSFNTRVNILYNEALRLVDMTYISAITAPQVNEQINKTLHAYSALNSKINAVLAQKLFEDEITIDVSNFIGIDTTKIDSISLKSIKLKKETEKQINDELNDFKRLSRKSLKLNKKVNSKSKKKNQ